MVSSKNQEIAELLGLVIGIVFNQLNYLFPLSQETGWLMALPALFIGVPSGK